MGAPWLWNAPLTTHHPPAPWASSCLINWGDKNSLPYQNNLLQGISNINFIFVGVTQTSAAHGLFSRVVALLVFAPVAPLPPDGFVLVRWGGGLCGDFCACVGLALLLRRGVLAGRQGHSIYWSEISIAGARRPCRPLAPSMWIRGFKGPRIIQIGIARS